MLGLKTADLVLYKRQTTLLTRAVPGGRRPRRHYEGSRGAGPDDPGSSKKKSGGTGMKTRTLAACFAMAAVIGLTGSAPLNAAAVEPGDRPEYTFENPLENGLGAMSLQDLRGKPLLVEFWGHR
jgi:hypothetical protein